MSVRLFLTQAACVVATCAFAEAGVITGHLRDTQGQPVRNAVFQFDLASDSVTPIVVAGFTDANGDFTTTLTPDGTYRMIVYPQPPPLSSVVTKRFEDILVGPTPNHLGTLELQNGVAVSGRVVNLAGTPLVDVGMEFTFPGESQWLKFTNHDTAPNGTFTVNAPFGECEIGFEPGPVPYYGGIGTGPTSRILNLSGPVNIGDVVLPLGYVVSTTVRRQSDSAPLEDVGVEFVRRSNGRPAYTPHNRTGPTGTLSIVVAGDNYDIRFMPRSNDGVIGATLPNRTIPPGGPLGTIVLADGVEVRGRVRGDNVSYAGITVQLVNVATNTEVVLENSVTDATGRYEIIVAPGTYHVTFSAPLSIPFGSVTIPNFVVQGGEDPDNDLDASLPSLPFSTLVGTGLPGTGGITPAIGSAGGTPRLGNSAYTLNFSEARGGATGLVIYTFSSGGPSHGPQLFARSTIALSGTPGAAGAGSGAFHIPIPNDGSLVGQTLRAFLRVRDGGGTYGYSSTQELRALIQP